jgi:hypothetical protein
MQNWMNVREEALNVLLAELLAEKGLKALGEVILKRNLPDVLIYINGIRIIIEAKKLGNREQLRKDCEDRLDKGMCDICVMVEYAALNVTSISPTVTDLKKALLTGKFNVGFMTYIDRIGLEKWISNFKPKIKSEFYQSIDFQEFVTYLMSAYEYTVQEDIVTPVVEKLRVMVDDFSRVVLSSGVDINRLKDVLELKEKEKEKEG